VPRFRFLATKIFYKETRRPGKAESNSWPPGFLVSLLNLLWLRLGCAASWREIPLNSRPQRFRRNPLSTADFPPLDFLKKSAFLCEICGFPVSRPGNILRPRHHLRPAWPVIRLPAPLPHPVHSVNSVPTSLPIWFLGDQIPLFLVSRRPHARRQPVIIPA
jgi:hypothetical protein